MATKKMQRKKPGYTKSGEVKIISLSVKQLLDMKDKTSKDKIKAKIERRLKSLGYVDPGVSVDVE